MKIFKAVLAAAALFSAGGSVSAQDLIDRGYISGWNIMVDPALGNGCLIQKIFQDYSVVRIGFDAEKDQGYFVVFNEAWGRIKKGQTYDIVFRAARFADGKMTGKPLVTMYFNGKKVHTDQVINKVWGGPNSGVDGGNDDGFGITDTPQGLKLQCEGHDVRYRNAWIKDLDLKEHTTDF